MTKNKQKKDSQGSLEYLIIVAAVLAIGAIVVLFLTGAFQSTNQDITACKVAATNCNAELATSSSAVCPYCTDSCSSEFIGICEEGKPDDIYLGALGTGSSGIDVTFTDAPGTIESLTMTVTKVEAIKDGKTLTLFSGARQVQLKEGLVQNLLAKKIPKGEYNSFKIYLADTVKIKDYSGEQFTAEVTNGVMTVDLNKEVLADETIYLLVDIPLDTALQTNAAPDNYHFSPAEKPLAYKGIEQGVPTQQDGVRTLTQDEALQLMEKVGNTNVLQKGNAAIKGFISIPEESNAIIQEADMKIKKIELVQQNGVARDLLVSPVGVKIKSDTINGFLAREIPVEFYKEMIIHFEPVGTIIDNSGIEHNGQIIESRTIRVNINREIAQGETFNMVIDFQINDLIKANDFKDSLFQFVAPESPTTIAGIEQGPFAKKNPGVLNEQEVNDLFFVIGGPGIGEMVA